MTYQDFLRRKLCLAENRGFVVDPDEVNLALKPHQRDSVLWGVRRGAAAIFESFGLGKTIIQLEIVRLILKQLGRGRGLIVTPLGVRQEFQIDAVKVLGWAKPPTFIRTTAELNQLEIATESGGPGEIYLTNYESIRDGKLDLSGFPVVSLDEAAILRGFGGTKTFRELMRLFEGTSTYRFVATAVPSPNEFIELLAYAAYLGVMEVSEAKTRFFKRDSTKADRLTLHAHKEQEFFLWLASWALFVQKPSDLGHDDTGYNLPPLEVRWHEIPSDHSNAGHERDGQGKLIKDAALGVQDAAREKRDSLHDRISKMTELLPSDGEQFIVWCDRNDEQRAIEATLEARQISCSSLDGSMDVDDREVLLRDWRAGNRQGFVSKPQMYGAGVNLQQCNRAIFAGIGFRFSEFIQAIARIHRFLQTRGVIIDLIYTEAERRVRTILERKWQQHKELVQRMAEIIQQYGLARAAMEQALGRTLGVERVERSGQNWKLACNDAVFEAETMPSDSVDLILTSIPFSMQYEYSPSFHDFGCNESNEAFFEQMDYLTPNLLRILKPGRTAAIHVKDRIVPGGLTGLGFQTVYRFADKTSDHFEKHGFAFMGRITVCTDVVRENNSTYRLGWTEQCKDGTKMGRGMPEYILLFRKPPTDRTNSYGDFPVKKSKPETRYPDGHVGSYDYDGGEIVVGTGYSRARWQIDAHGFWRSSGNRLLTAEEMRELSHADIYKRWREESLATVYDHERHVFLGEVMEQKKRLPSNFMLMPPHSWHPEVWSDVTRMRTLNGAQSAKGKQMHLCPLQFDIADRIIVGFSEPGEIVWDPFVGIGTVPYQALKLGRVGLGTELSATYFLDACGYLQVAEREVSIPDFFDLLRETPVDEPVSTQHAD